MKMGENDPELHLLLFLGLGFLPFLTQTSFIQGNDILHDIRRKRKLIGGKAALSV